MARFGTRGVPQREVTHRRIHGFMNQWNEGATPFTWVKGAYEILAKTVRKTKSKKDSRH